MNNEYPYDFKKMIMKKTNPLLKIGLVGLFLTLSSIVFAQTAPTPVIPITTAANLNIGFINDSQTEVSVNNAAILFLNPNAGGSSITLQASTHDEDNINEFDLWAWYLVDPDGDEIGSAFSNDREITVSGTDLGPGYHRFRVFGFVTEGDLDCQSEEYQDIILFILNPLTPTAETSAIEEYCIGDDGTLELVADISFAEAYQNGDFPNPVVADFAITYRWYAVRNGDDANRILLNTETASGGTNTLELDHDALTVAGNYTFYVEVEYSSDIKDREERGLGHGFWRADVQKSGATYQVEVAPRPGRPTITIENIVD